MSGATIASKVFGDELKWIADPDLRNFTLQCFDILSPRDHYFWTRPAARGGHHVTYHPASFRADCGLVGHTSLVAYLAWSARRMYDAGAAGFKGDEPSLHSCEVVAAALLHDVLKDGHLATMTPDRKKVMGGYHGIEMANMILAMVPGDHMANPRRARVIMAIGAHMGPWTTVEHLRPDRLKDPQSRHVAQWLATSDYMASKDLDTQIQSRSMLMRRVANVLRENGHVLAGSTTNPMGPTSPAMAAAYAAVR